MKTTLVDMLYVIGNSHVDNLVNDLPNHLYNKIQMPGASIKGLVNPTSKLGLREAIVSSIDSNSNKKYIFLLGQVDIEFGYYYKSMKEGKKLDFKEYVDNLIKKYSRFLDTFPQPFAICSIYPSVIKNIEHNFNVSFKCPYGVEGKYSEVNNELEFTSELSQLIYSDSYEQRLNMCRYFNKKLYEFCSERNYPFIDLWDELMQDEFSVKAKYIPSSKMEHHLASVIPKEIICQKIFESLYKQS